MTSDASTTQDQAPVGGPDSAQPTTGGAAPARNGPGEGRPADRSAVDGSNPAGSDTTAVTDGGGAPGARRGADGAALSGGRGADGGTLAGRAGEDGSAPGGGADGSAPGGGADAAALSGNHAGAGAGAGPELTVPGGSASSGSLRTAAPATGTAAPARGIAAVAARAIVTATGAVARVGVAAREAPRRQDGHGPVPGWDQFVPPPQGPLFRGALGRKEPPVRMRHLIGLCAWAAALTLIGLGVGLWAMIRLMSYGTPGWYEPVIVLTGLAGVGLAIAAFVVIDRRHLPWALMGVSTAALFLAIGVTAAAG